ncbi:hypothetical protein [Mycobacterium sp.]|uniref:hypothetical protein n=1 Tax=Mycobacterium sp. TaxID=1785 RepID=UPI002BEFD1ED|nr:hypothetical protein [Mycobacterium sp.]HTQ20416.1 hypothetical protein [Mycobacterium sp.]
MSGFFNEAGGGSSANGSITGFLNTGIPTQPDAFPGVSGVVSGALNTGTFVSGFIGLGVAIGARLP